MYLHINILFLLMGFLYSILCMYSVLCMYLCMYVCILCYVCTYVRMYVCILCYVCTYVCMYSVFCTYYVCMCYVCVYIYIDINTFYQVIDYRDLNALLFIIIFKAGRICCCICCTSLMLFVQGLGGLQVMYSLLIYII